MSDENIGMKFDKPAALSWCLYDWASSAFPTVITTFIFATYFIKGIAPNIEEGTALWGNGMAVAGITLALLAPIFGAIADFAGNRKVWLAFCTVICVGASGLLWFATPEVGSIYFALFWVVIATLGFEFSMVFYNAYLPELAPRSHWGRLSGWGWGLGYFGGLAALALALFGFVQTDNPLFGVGTDQSENIRACAVVVAVWFAVFSVPVFLYLPKQQSKSLPLTQAVKTGCSNLVATLKGLPQHKSVLGFLIARMIYTDGLNTLFAFGGIFAAGTFGMELSEVILFGITLNVTAGIGAALFAWGDDWWGPKRVILISLAALILLSVAGVFAPDKTTFWIVGLLIGIFLGPTQSASRSVMARLAPENLHTEYFGLYALSGKATAFIGPWILGMTTLAFESQRAGMATIVIFFLVGALLMLRLDIPKK